MYFNKFRRSHFAAGHSIIIGWGIIIFLCTNCNLATYAQSSKLENNRDFFLGAGIIANTGTFIDQQFSSLFYKGKNIGGSIDFNIKKQHVWQRFTTGFSQGIFTESKTGNTAKQSYFTAEYTRLYSLNKDEDGLLLMTGGQCEMLYAKRKYSHFINRTENNEFAVSLAATFLAQYSFDKVARQGFVLSNQLSFPLVSLIQQPVFGTDQSSANINEEKSTVNSFFRNSHLTSFNNYLRISNTIQLQKYLAEKQGFSIAYTWDYYQVTTIVKTAQVRHSATIAYFFKL